MQSEIRPGSDSLSQATSAKRSMVGQSDYVVNTGLAYTSPGGGISITALYNVVGRRIAEAAPRPLPDTYEEARHLVDLSAQFQPWPSVSVKLDAKNLLDAPYRFTQGDVVRLRYKSGRSFSVGFGWTP
jgi:outer membrane receptor protein involved in Fe transport